MKSQPYDYRVMSDKECVGHDTYRTLTLTPYIAVRSDYIHMYIDIYMHLHGYRYIHVIYMCLHSDTHV